MNYKLIRKKYNDNSFDCILEQIFFKGIFHADPHPGNGVYSR
ncbi:AarF/UbiB family protein [Bacillus pacificus]